MYFSRCTFIERRSKNANVHLLEQKKIIFVNYLNTFIEMNSNEENYQHPNFITRSPE